MRHVKVTEPEYRYDYLFNHHIGKVNNCPGAKVTIRRRTGGGSIDAHWTFTWRIVLLIGVFRYTLLGHCRRAK